MNDLLKAAACFAGVALLAADVRADGRAARLDRALTRRLPSRRPGAAAARAVTRLGDPRVAFPVAAAVRARRGTGPFGALVVGAVARKLLSDAVARPRPPEAGRWDRPEGFSFPSKHTTAAVLAAGAAADGDPRAGATAGALVGATRLYLGVHWPGDVAAGALTGLGFLYAARALRRA
ncbi:phosphatase PAP2 family protein [Actinomadura atramentaria]|uniref:phosphatase PAP2 family protein n=1 Tax=Actinomadura atramentaria TaxID=1990 RepID=UPI00036C8131|nr:phosphatase PAP2 family protein [Actinomadura atramentaria]